MSIFKGITFKRANVREFLFFLLLTTVLAILIKLSKDYTKIYSLPVSVVSTPIDKVVSTIQPNTLDVTTRLSGFALLSNQFSDFELAIDFNQLEKTSNKQYRYIPEGHPLEIANAFSGVSEVTAISPQQVAIQIDSLASKDIPVKSSVVTQYKTGYGPNGKAALEPATVRIVGPKAYIDTITSVQTVPKNIAEVSENIAVTLSIDSLALHEEVRLSSYAITYTQGVAKFTEGSFSIPVKLINAGGTAVKIFPKTVDVYFTVPIDAYESITSNDFEVVCDFKNRNVEDDFIALTVRRSSKSAKNIRLATKQIKYIVVN
ncbi:CdaR family protein [uncultured Dokdonia sp.]|uniref:CdaR family protein n=1 Tax=uncultured Dokdonia sp. TaxID=575653 RepID=UPI002625FE4E|nr:CdaR family protein [uncultured Dokdonia sp.]